MPLSNSWTRAPCIEIVRRIRMKTFLLSLIAIVLCIIALPARTGTFEDFIADKTITGHAVCKVPLPNGRFAEVICVRLGDEKEPQKFWVVFLDPSMNPLLIVEDEGGVLKVVWEYTWVSI